MRNSKSRRFSLVGSESVSITENTSLMNGKVVSRRGIKIVQSHFVSCNVSNDYLESLIENSMFDNCFVMLRVGASTFLRSIGFVRSFLYLLGIGNTVIENSNFSQDTSVLVVGGSTVSVDNSNFTQNTNALSIENISILTITQSTFIGNINCLSYQNNNYTVANCLIRSCLFQDNWSRLGGALYAESASVSVSNSKFLNNKATNGGAIYLKQSFLAITYSYFGSNEAILVNSDCTTQEECGNGGVIYTNGEAVPRFIRSTAENNRAVKGGICFNSCDLSDYEILNNTASYSGDVIFFGKDISKEPSIQNTSLGSSRLRSVKWKIHETGKIYTSNIFNTISLFPGEVVKIEFTLVDLFNNSLESAQAVPSIIATNSNSSIVTREATNSKSNLTLFVYYELFEGETIINSTVLFPDRDYSFVFGISVKSCPFEYGYDGPSSNRVCTFRNYSAIIVSAVFGVIIMLIFVGIGMFATLKISQKLVKLHRKERSEKKIANKLIEKKFVFGEEEFQEPLLINRIRNSDVSNIIIPIEDIEILKRIGEGSNGIVYLASWNGTKVALKSIKTDGMEVSDDEFEHEASLLNSLKHPSIMRFYGVSLSNTSKYMVVEYLENGSLEIGISQSKLGIRKLGMKKKIQILKGISSGMDYLHSLKPRSILHRDLKPGNILLDSNMDPKVCDFGLSKVTSNTGSSAMTTNLGTILYMAPELIGSGHAIGNALDVYSFSIIMYELFFEERPYFSNSNKINKFSKETLVDDNLFSIPVKVVRGERPKIPWHNKSEFELWIEEFVEPFEKPLKHSTICEICLELTDLMAQCWNSKPEKRPTFKEITQTLNRIQTKLA